MVPLIGGQYRTCSVAGRSRGTLLNYADTAAGNFIPGLRPDADEDIIVPATLVVGEEIGRAAFRRVIIYPRLHRPFVQRVRQSRRRSDETTVKVVGRPAFGKTRLIDCDRPTYRVESSLISGPRRGRVGGRGSSGFIELVVDDGTIAEDHRTVCSCAGRSTRCRSERDHSSREG